MLAPSGQTNIRWSHRRSQATSTGSTQSLGRKLTIPQVTLPWPAAASSWSASCPPRRRILVPSCSPYPTPQGTHECHRKRPHAQTSMSRFIIGLPKSTGDDRPFQDTLLTCHGRAQGSGLRTKDLELRKPFRAIPHLQVNDPGREVTEHTVPLALDGLRVQPHHGRRRRGHRQAERPPEDTPPLRVHVFQEETELVVHRLPKFDRVGSERVRAHP